MPLSEKPISQSLSQDEKHQQGIRLFQEGQFEESARLIGEALLGTETSERWNDWATAVLSCGRPAEAEKGFRRALEMDPQNSEAAANLGVLLVGRERAADAVPFLERGMARADAKADKDQRAQLVGLLADCRSRQAQNSKLILDTPSARSALRVPSPRKKIVFTGDVLRPMPDGTSHQALNIQWLADMLRYPVSMAADAELDVHLWDAGKGSIDGPRFYELNSSAVSPENWGRLFDAREISLSSAEYLGTFFEDAVVVGFELPDVMIRLFQARGVPYLDLFIHPVRYLEDLFFGIRTNVAEMFEVLTRHAVPEELFHMQAGIHKATMRRTPPLDIRRNTCLFVGQTPMDKSLLVNGNVLSVENFAEQIQQIARSSEKVYFKPHPYGSDEGQIMKILGGAGKAEITRANVYHLLAQDNIQEVFGISSSVLHEAEYFGKKVTHLSKNRLNLYGPQQTDFDPWTFVPVLDAFYNPRFWSELLGSVCAVKQCPDLHLSLKSSRLRTSLQMFWGYNFLDAELLLHNIKNMGGFDFGGAATPQEKATVPGQNNEPAPPEQNSEPAQTADPAESVQPVQESPPAVPEQSSGMDSEVQKVKKNGTGKSGVSFHASVYGGSGYSDECLAVVLGLAEHQLAVQLHPLVFQSDTRNLLSREVQNTLEELKRQPVNLARSIYYQCVPAHDFNRQAQARCRVGRTMFESDSIPDGWAERCQAMDEIWVPSEFNRETFASAGVDERKLRVVPAGVNTKLFRPGLEPLSLARTRGFNFLSMFEWTDRKAPDVLLRAYLSEFKPDEDVALILKSYARPDPNADLLPRLAHFIEREAGLTLDKAPPIILLTGFLSNADMPRLHSSADAFVLPSRGEGYGRPYMEALACGRPVIATRWSGQMDFLHEENSYLIDLEGVVPTPPDVDVELYAGHRWAEPSVEHLRQLMRQVFSQHEEAQRRAERGRAEMVRDWDWNVVIKRWVNEFERLMDSPFASAAPEPLREVLSLP